MSNQKKSPKIKIIQFKDIVSIILIAVILSCGFIYSYAAINTSLNFSYATVGGSAGTSENITANDLLVFNRMANSVFGNSTYNKIKDSNLDKLKFYKESVPGVKGYESFKNSGWKVANYTTVGTIIKNDNKFPMTICTFIKEDALSINIVIAYSATASGEGWNMLLNGELFDSKGLMKIKDLQSKDKLFNTGNWGQDIIAVFLGYTGMEFESQKYATNVAKYYHNIKGQKTLNIHLTGHSLGGYLAQVGGAGLLQNSTYKKYVKQIGYFNGFGIYVNQSSIISDKIRNGLLETIKKFYNIKITIKEIDSFAQKTYTTLKNNKEKVTLYKIRGDWASPLGYHAGNVKEFYPATKAIDKKQTNASAIMLEATLKLLYKTGLFKMDCTGYPTLYKLPDYSNYMWVTHDLPSFEGWDLVNEKRIVDLKTVYFSNVPYIISKNKQATITLTIKMDNAELKERLLTSDFIVSSYLNIISITQSSANKKIDYNKPYETVYTIKITVKATRTVVLPSITLKSAAFKITPNPNGFSKLNVKNDILIGNYILVKI